MPGIDPVDYSHGNRLTLDENNLNEAAGMCVNPVVPIDWNFDGNYTSSLVVDINPEDGNFIETQLCGGTQTVLHDYNEWAHLKISSVAPAFFNQGAGAPLPITGEICTPIPL